MLDEYFYKAYNIDVKAEWTAFNKLKKKIIYSNMNKPLYLLEFNMIIKKLTIQKDPICNGVSPNTIKH